MYTKTTQLPADYAEVDVTQLIDPVSVVHRGRVILFARQAGQTTASLYYNIRLDTFDDLNYQQDWSGWRELALDEVDNQELLRVTGMDLITVSPTATTADPADAAFRVAADPRLVYLFRQSGDGTLYVNRLVMVEEPMQPDLMEQEEADEGRVQTTYRLDFLWEVRYRRSGKKDTPADDQDTLGNRDMDGRIFYEPTLALTEVVGVADGHFAVVLAPTAAVDTGRWHFFVREAAGTKVTAYSYAQAAGGLFDFDTAKTAPFDITPYLKKDSGAPVAGSCTAGPAATLYYDQEPIDNDVADQTLRRGARLMLAVPASVTAEGLTAASFFYDFGLGRDGTIGAFDGSTGSLLIDGTLSGGSFTPNRSPGSGYPVPDDAVHTAGDLTVAAVVLGQAEASAVPGFLDSGDGLLHYYFAGQPDSQSKTAFLVAQYSPVTTRFAVNHGWVAGSENGTLQFIAERAGSSMNGMTVAIADSAAGADLCDIQVDYGSAADIPAETWKGVPRELLAAIAVLNGTASSAAENPEVRANQTVFYDYGGTRQIARLPLDDETSPSGFVSLVSRRSDLTFGSAAVAAGTGSGTVNVTLNFTAASTAVTWTWSDLPDLSSGFAPDLRGDASPRNYNYSLPSGDTQVISLQTTGGAILFLAASGTLGNCALITVVNDGLEEEQLCKVTIDPDGGTPVVLSSVSRKQADFINTLAADSGVKGIFFHISADPASGLVVNQQSPLGDLRDAALAFSVVDQSDGDTLVPTAAPITAQVIQGHSATPAQTDLADRLIAATAVALTLPNDGAAGLLQNGSGTAGTPASNGLWTWQPQLQALDLGGQNAMSVALSGTAPEVLSPQRYFTVESWICPNTSTPTRVVCFNDGEAATPGGVVPSYMLGTTGHPAVAFGASQSTTAYAGSYIQITANSIFIPDGAFTWSGWVKPAANPAPSSSAYGVLFALSSVTFPDAPTLMLGLDSTRQLVFGYRDENTQFQTITDTPQAIAADTWTYISVAGKQASDKSWSVVLYVNAVAGSPHGSLKFDSSQEAPIGYIGTSAINNRSIAGSINELRFWQTYRFQAEIERTMHMTLSGTESGLMGYWPLTEDPTGGATITNRATATGSALNGTVHRQDNEQPMSQQTDGTFLSVLAGIGGVDAVVGHGFLLSGHWNHLAAVFESGTAVNLNPDATYSQGQLDYANCGSSSELNLSNAGSLEAFILVPTSNRRNNVIMAKWGAEDGEQSYKLYLNADKKLAMTLVLEVPVYDQNNPQIITGYEPKSFTATAGSAIDTAHHHVVGTYQIESIVDTNANDTTKIRGVLKLFVDGAAAGTVTTDWYAYAATIGIRKSDASFTIGMQMLQTMDTPSVAIESQEYFQGVVTGVRLWTEALDSPRIAQVAGKRLEDSEGGLISAWWFGEQAGSEAADSIAGNDARLSSAGLWVLYRPLGRLTCYANGYRVGLYDAATAAQAVGYVGGQAQFTAGAYIDGSTYNAGYIGKMQELRIWNMARTVEAFRENMFRFLTGYERNLVGYWSLNGDSDDGTVYGNDGSLVGSPTPTFATSTAPVSNEAPPVKNVYSDHVTEFQEPIDGTPSVVEYGDVKREVDGTLTAIQDRDYFYVNQALVIAPDFKVGDLDLIYLGQVQTSPTLIGYIEGAPPVPSENLSRPLYNSAFAYNGYFDATSISLTQSESKTFSFATADSNTTQMQNISGVLGAFGNWKVSTNQGSPFFSIGDDKFTNVVKLGLKFQVSHLEAEGENHSVSSGWTNQIQDRFSLRGNWEAAQSDPQNYLNPQVGRRFLPDNLGYALVESLTADLYSMQLASTGQMIGKVVVPNLEIPPDKNIITFRIDPAYVKNGTLDGKVGLYDDPDWLGADSQRGSYFKAKEAYALKSRINRETVTLESFYDQFDASARGRSQNTDLGDAAKEQFYDWDEQVARKSLVNSYVWTASGGLHAEEQQVNASRETSYSGTYNLNWVTGPSFEMQVALYVGVYAGLDLLFGHQTNVTVTKSMTESQSFGMNAVVTGDPFLLAWDPTAEAYSSSPCPGKVDAYRFMTFYLAPDTANADSFLDKVVDEDWLRNSADPNAIALRGAVIEGNKVWRILHRVTYVSRVAPTFDSAPNQQVSRKVNQSIVVADNQRLIQLVQQSLGTEKPTAANIGAAVTAVLAPASGNAVLSAEVPWWQTFLDAARGGSDPDAAQEMAQLRLDTLTYMLKGYELGLLPVASP